MSYTVDVNILLYASDRESPFHEAAAAFLRERAEDRDIFCLTWPVVMAYLRLATHPRVFEKPLTPTVAISNVEALLRMPRCRVVSEPENFLDVYREVAVDVTARGNLVPDAHVAALARAHSIRTIYTHDRDFRRFGFLRVVDPVASL